MPHPAERIERLPIRVRHLVASDGAERMLHSVYCPVRGCAVPTADCARCPRLVTLDFDLRDRTPAVVCTVPARREAPIPRGAIAATLERTPLREVMRPDVTCVDACLDLEAAAGLFLDGGADALPVVDDDGVPYGIVTKTDVLRDRYPNAEAADLAADPGCDLEGATSVRRTVADVMTPIAYSLDESASLADAAMVMETERVGHLAVVGADGQVVGILSGEDIVRWLCAHVTEGG